jgi:hypothetical protein
MAEKKSRRAFLNLIAIAFSAIALCAGIAAIGAQEALAASSFLVAESSGEGASRAEALLDARRNAVEQAVGYVSKGTAEAVDGRVAESIVILSRAFIEKYEILEETRDGGKFRVAIKAWIHKENLIEGLARYRPGQSAVDGRGLLTRSLSRDAQIKEASDMLQECFGSIPASNYIRVSAAGENFRAGDGILELNVDFSFDRERFFTVLAPQFATVLSYIAEAGMSDVPMRFELGAGKQIPPPPPGTFSEYARLMEISDGGRYIESPAAGGFANIYVMTKNYYFNCYRVAPEAFAPLLESVFAAGGGGRLTGGAFGKSELVITFRAKGGQKIAEHRQKIAMTNAMVFANAGGLKKSPYAAQKKGPLDERNHAVFIMPFIGVLSDGGADYSLVENDAALLRVPMKPEQMKLTERIECEIFAE